jgi:hypothetical protein
MSQNLWNATKFFMVALVLGLLFIRIDGVGGYYWEFTVYIGQLIGAIS